MAKPSIQTLTTAQTFQNWLDKTNELVSLIREEVMTASAGGDTTVGNATLDGNFAATNISVSENIEVNSLSAFGNDTLDINSPIQVVGTEDPICAIFRFVGSGGRTRYTDGTTSWDIGIEESSEANFIIDTGIGDRKFKISPNGTLTIPNLIVTEGISGDGFEIELDSDSIEEGSNNLFFTDQRADARISTIVNKSYVDELDINAERVGNIQGSSILRNDTDGTLNGNLTIDGGLIVTGDITTDAEISDIRLKDDILKIEDSLTKVHMISGYTFEYKKKKGKRSTGLMAHELEEVLPEAVYKFVNENGEEYKAIRYGNVVSLLVESIKELSDKVEKLENQ